MNHIEKIAKALPEYHLDAMLVTSEAGEFYATGFHGEGVCLITPEKSYYFTDPRYIEAAEQTISGMSVSLPDAGCGYSQMVAQLVELHGVKRLGFEEESMTVAQYEAYTDRLSCEMVGATGVLLSLRQSKEPDEVDCIQRAQDITDATCVKICQYIKPGLTEQEISAQLVFMMMAMGAEKVSFDPIVASGPNGSRPHAIPGSRKVQEGDFITLDFGCKVGNYCSDMTRTIAVGQPTEEMKKVYYTVLEAQLAGIAVAKAGVPGREVHMAAQKVIEDAGYGAYFGHGFGHSLGIEIHENPNANAKNEEPLPEGAVISAEPGIYLPGRFGVRIEDILYLTKDGNENLTGSPKDLIIL